MGFQNRIFVAGFKRTRPVILGYYLSGKLLFILVDSLRKCKNYLTVPIDLPRAACQSEFATLRSVMVDHSHKAINDGQIPESLVNKASKHHSDPDCLRFSSIDHSFY